MQFPTAHVAEIPVYLPRCGSVPDVDTGLLPSANVMGTGANGEGSVDLLFVVPDVTPGWATGLVLLEFWRKQPRDALPAVPQFKFHDTHPGLAVQAAQHSASVRIELFRANHGPGFMVFATALQPGGLGFGGCGVLLPWLT